MTDNYQYLAGYGKGAPSFLHREVQRYVLNQGQNDPGQKGPGYNGHNFDNMDQNGPGQKSKWP